MDSDVRLLDFIGIRVVRVDNLGRSALYFSRHSIALMENGLTQEDEADAVDAILSAAISARLG